MSKQKICKQNIIDWINEVIIVPRQELGGMPICPFVKEYENKIRIIETTTPLQVAKNFAFLKELFDYEAVILYGKKYSYEKLHSLCDTINEKHAKHNVICLAMHPDSDEFPLPLEYNFEYPLLILQNKENLTKAQNRLENTPYYNYYSNNAK